MSRLATLALGLSTSFLAAPAFAEQPFPTVDFQGEWVLTSDKGLQMRAQMHYLATPRKMRVDMEQHGMAMSSVRDMETGELVMWSEQMPGMGMRLPSPKDEYEGERTDESKTVNGEGCTIWVMKMAEVCLTEDNIPLEVTTSNGIRSGLENLERVAQDPAMFEVPAGLNIMNMPTGAAGGAGPQPGQGMPF